MQKIEIHDIQAMLSQMNDEFQPFEEYKQKKIQKIYDFFKLDRENQQTITDIACSNVLYPFFLEFFGDVLNVKYSPLLEQYQFIFSDESKINELRAESWKNAHEYIEKSFKSDFLKPFDFRVKNPSDNATKYYESMELTIKDSQAKAWTKLLEHLEPKDYSYLFKPFDFTDIP